LKNEVRNSSTSKSLQFAVGLYIGKYPWGIISAAFIPRKKKI
jgi:hypothetical protein